jgi:hypothetical protein
MSLSRALLAVAAAAALAAAAACAGQKTGEPFGILSVDEVEKLVGTPRAFVVDANPEEVFRRNHLPGARWWRTAPLAQLLPADKDRTLVFYCAAPS